MDTTPEAPSLTPEQLEDVRQRAAGLSEVLLRVNAFVNMEMLVATCVLYLRSNPGANPYEAEALMRGAWNRYLDRKVEGFWQFGQRPTI